MQKYLVSALFFVISCYANATTCYQSVEVKTLDTGGGRYTSRYVTRIDGQLFYQSSGVNSSLAGIYFPFYGLLTNLNFSTWYVKPGSGTHYVYDKYVDTGSKDKIWDSYLYTDLEFNRYIYAHDSKYIEEKLHASEAQLRFGGYNTAKTSYRIQGSNFSGKNLENEFVGELSGYFENILKLKRDYTVNTTAPIKIFTQESLDETDTIYLTNEFNKYVKNSAQNWVCPKL